MQALSLKAFEGPLAAVAAADAGCAAAVLEHLAALLSTQVRASAL
jgi:hypothetical protein